MPARCSTSCWRGSRPRRHAAWQRAARADQARQGRLPRDLVRQRRARQGQPRALLRRSAAPDGGRRHPRHRRRQPHHFLTAELMPSHAPKRRDPADRFQLHGLCGAGRDRRQARLSGALGADHRRRRRLLMTCMEILTAAKNGSASSITSSTTASWRRLRRRRAFPTSASPAPSRQAEHRGRRDPPGGLSGDAGQCLDRRCRRQGRRDRPARGTPSDRRRGHRLLQAHRVHHRKPSRPTSRASPSARRCAS